MNRNAREVKQVIVMRKDLGMRKGKMVAQGAHASVAVISNSFSTEANGEYRIRRLTCQANSPIDIWLRNEFTKICVYVNSEEELFEIYQKARDNHFPCALIKDSGRTEFKEPTYTCCSIGPWWSEEINTITGDLKLL